MVAVTPCAALWFIFGAPITHRYQQQVKISDREISFASNSSYIRGPNTGRKNSEKSGGADSPGVGGYVGGGGSMPKLNPIREDLDRLVKSSRQHTLSPYPHSHRIIRHINPSCQHTLSPYPLTHPCIIPYDSYRSAVPMLSQYGSPLHSPRSNKTLNQSLVRGAPKPQSHRIYVDDNTDNQVSMINPSGKDVDISPLFFDGQGQGLAPGQGQGQGPGEGEKKDHVQGKDHDYDFFNDKYKYKKDATEGSGRGGGGAEVDHGQHPTTSEGNPPVSAESVAATLLSVPVSVPIPGLKLTSVDDKNDNDMESKQGGVVVPTENERAMHVESFREVLTFRGDQPFRGENLSGKNESPKRRRLSASPGMPGN